MPKRENVAHYNTGEIETIDYIFDKLGFEGGQAYVLGNILKYASRALYKGTFDADVEKIRNYAVILQEKTAEYQEKLADQEHEQSVRDIRFGVHVEDKPPGPLTAMQLEEMKKRNLIHMRNMDKGR